MDLPLVHRDIVFVDLEMTSLSLERGEITEIAAVRVSPDLMKERGAVHRKTRIERPGEADPEALKINGYDPRVWAREAVHVRAALVEYAALLATGEPPVYGGVNAIFDILRIRRAAEKERIVIPEPRFILDVQNMAWPLLVSGKVERLNLDVLCLRYGIPSRGAHTAMVDVRRTMALYRKLLGWQPREVA